MKFKLMRKSIVVFVFILSQVLGYIDLFALKVDYNMPEYTRLCLPKVKYACNEDGCQKINTKVFLAYDEKQKIIYRCDDKPCDGYKVKETKSGQYYSYIQAINNNGLSVKFFNKSDYVETVSHGLDVLITYGSCKERNY